MSATPKGNLVAIKVVVSKATRRPGTSRFVAATTQFAWERGKGTCLERRQANR
jgi:hypothetical protein